MDKVRLVLRRSLPSLLHHAVPGSLLLGERFQAGAVSVTSAGSSSELEPGGPLKTPVLTSTDTQGGPARFAPRTSAAGLSPTSWMHRIITR